MEYTLSQAELVDCQVCPPHSFTLLILGNIQHPDPFNVFIFASLFLMVSDIDILKFDLHTWLGSSVGDNWSESVVQQCWCHIAPCTLQIVGR